MTIDHSKANYVDYVTDANPLNLSEKPYTSPVDYYSSYGYGFNDMAGNVSEWTSSPRYPGSNIYVDRGGSWYWYTSYCEVSGRSGAYQHATANSIGFRVVR